VPLLLAASADVRAQDGRLNLPAEDRTLSVEFRPLYSVGRADGSPVETFADVPAVAFDERARLYVLDRGNTRVVVFDSTGRHVRTIGRRGAGPGEFTAPSGIAIVAGNMLAVADAALRSISLFDAAGVYLRTVPVGNVRALYPSMQSALDGGVLMQETATSRDHRDRHVIYHHSLAEGHTAVARFQTARRDSAVQIVGSGNVRQRVLPPVFQPAVRFAVWSPGIIAVAATETYGIAISGGALPVTSIARPLRPRAVTEADREAARARIRARSSSAATLPNGFTALPDLDAAANLRFADVMPVISGLGVDAGGMLWIARGGSPAFSAGPIDLVRRDGSYVGTIPSAEQPAAFGPGRRVAFLRRDANGVESVTVVRTIMH
jgi:hypothetical protein